MKKILFYIKLIALMLVAFIFAFFGVSNNDPVTVDLLGGKADIRLSILLGISLFLGFLLGVLGAIYTSTKIKVSRSLTQKKAAKVEKKTTITSTEAG